MFKDLINKIKGWWKSMFDYNRIAQDFNLDIQTSKEILEAIQKWSQIYNGHEPWINEEVKSLHTAKTICEKVAEAVVVEFKCTCSDKYINNILQKSLKKLQNDTEAMLGKSLIYFRPFFNGSKISVNHIQADKYIPVKFDSDGNLLSCIIIDQITKENDVYTRLEYNELIENKMIIRNVAYKGRKDGIIFESKIDITNVPEWKDIQDGKIEGIDRLIGGLATMRNVNSIDNNSPIGVPIYYNALDTLKEIDLQWSRTIWEFEGSELAIDIDESLLITENGKYKYPKGKKRLFRKYDFEDDKDKKYNIFSPTIRDSSFFNGLNSFLREAEVQCHLEHGTLSKTEVMEKSATEAKQLKQSYYITVKNIQHSLQDAIDDLIYGIYVLCKLYNMPVQSDYTVEYDWDDSILVDKETMRNQALIERNNGITSDVQYIMETRNMKEKDAIEFIKNQNKYKKLTQKDTEIEVSEE